jgi:hypothetical protein
MNRVPQENDSISAQPTTSAALEAVKAELRAAWESRDFAIGGNTLAAVGSALCDVVGLYPGSRVLEVAPDHGDCAFGTHCGCEPASRVALVPQLSGTSDRIDGRHCGSPKLMAPN